MRLLFDTNVVLDLLLDREPFVETSAILLSRVEAGDLTGYLCATTITTIHYLATKTIGTKQALSEIRKLLSLFEVAPVNRPMLEEALETGFTDFENGVLHEAARQVNAQAIVTRNGDDFRKAVLPVYSPEEVLQILSLRDQSAE